MGVYYARRDELPEARRHFEQALRVKPDYQAAQNNLRGLRELLEEREEE